MQTKLESCNNLRSGEVKQNQIFANDLIGSLA